MCNKEIDDLQRETYSNVVHQHLVEAHWSERALDDVGDGCCGHDCKDKEEVATSEQALNYIICPFKDIFSMAVASYNNIAVNDMMFCHIIQ